MLRIRKLFGSLLTAFVCLLGNAAHAQDVTSRYPERPIRVIVPYGAGGGTDVVLRLLSERISQFLGQPLVVENRTGAAGLIGATAVARSKPDGYTLLVGTLASNVLSPLLKRQPPFDPQSDFIPISKLCDSPFVLVVRPASGAHTVAGLIEILMREPKQNSYGSAGLGGPGQLSGALFLSETKTQAQFVPYRGESQVLSDLLAGQLNFFFGSASAVIGLAQTNTVKALAVTSRERLPPLPDVPTTAELGLRQVNVITWFGMFAPQGTPSHIVDKLSMAVKYAVDDPAIQAKGYDLGVRLISSSPDEFRQEIKHDLQRLPRVLALAGVEKEE